MEQNNYSEKNWIKTLLLCWSVGIFGVHRSYVGKKKTGWLQFFTLGGFGIWTLIDLYLIATQKFTDHDGNYIKNNNKKLHNVVGIIFIILCLINIYAVRNGIKELRNTEVFSNYNIMKNTDIDASIKVFVATYTNEEEEKLKQEIEKIEGVLSVELNTKEQGFSEYMEKFGEKAYLFENWIDTIPDTYIVKISKIDSSERISDEISELSNVTKVTNEYKSLQTIKSQKNVMIFEMIMINIAFLYNILITFVYGIIAVEILKKENN